MQQEHVDEKTTPQQGGSKNNLLKAISVAGAIPAGLALSVLGNQYITGKATRMKNLTPLERDLFSASGVSARTKIIPTKRFYEAYARFIPGLDQGPYFGGNPTKRDRLQHLAIQGVYSPAIGHKKDTPSILAHELGHLMNARDKTFLNNLRTRTASTLRHYAGVYPEDLPAVGTAFSLMAGVADPKMGRVIQHLRPVGLGMTALSTLGFMPTILEELSASHRGGKLYSGITGKMSDYIKPFLGTPTYIAAASAPLAAYPAGKLVTRIIKNLVK